MEFKLARCNHGGGDGVENSKSGGQDGQSSVQDRGTKHTDNDGIAKEKEGSLLCKSLIVIFLILEQWPLSFETPHIALIASQKSQT